MKIDGHTHTQYCLHGSGEEAEAFVLKAIEKGFTQYSITEHPPLPASFLTKLPYTQGEIATFNMKDEDMDSYIKEMQVLKSKYKDKIAIKIGLELDYLPAEITHLRYLLKEYGSYLDDALLSLHFLWGRGGWRCVDHSSRDFQEGLIEHYSTYEEAQLAYYGLLEEAIKEDLGRYKPKRIGHMTLCNKFQHALNPQGLKSPRVNKSIENILGLMVGQGYSIDVNVAGLYKEHCGEIYPPLWVIEKAKELGIPMVYGSDAHAVEDVGRSYDVYTSLLGS